MIVNQTSQRTIAASFQVAKGAWQRMKGLLGTQDFVGSKALVLAHCQSIHMVFMKFPIDVIFCDAQNKVVGLCHNIKPFCFSPIFFKASFAIELPAGTINTSKTQLGDQIDISSGR